MARTPLDALLTYFPAGATESERHIMSRVFVYWEDYADLLTPPPTSPRLMVGRKGTGKTALIDFYLSLLIDARLPAIVIRPMDIDVSAFPEKAALGEATRIALGALSKAIAQRLGSEVGGFILDDGSKRLYEEAVAGGVRDRDVVEKLAQLLPRLAKGITKLDLSGFAPNAERASIVHLTEAIKDNVTQSGRTFHLFLDDTDQVAAPDEPGHLQRIWAFLLAARELCQQIPQLRCVISLREEIWRRLLRDAAGQRDQADHFLPLVRELFPSREHISRVVRRRLSAACEDLGLATDHVFAPFFEGDGAKMPDSQEFRSWDDLIVVRSRERPRDAIQLINKLAYTVRQQGGTRITESDFHRVMSEFSETRVTLLAQEAEQECPQIVEVVNALSEINFDVGGYKASAEQFRQFMRTMPSRFGVELRGRRLTPNDDNDAILLWDFLFELGVVNARVADNRQKDGYRHIMPREDTRLVSKARWNDMQGIIWEINPAYRDHLNRLRSESFAAKVGLPPAHQAKKRRRR